MWDLLSGALASGAPAVHQQTFLLESCSEAKKTFSFMESVSAKAEDLWLNWLKVLPSAVGSVQFPGLELGFMQSLCGLVGSAFIEASVAASQGDSFGFLFAQANALLFQCRITCKMSAICLTFVSQTLFF